MNFDAEFIKLPAPVLAAKEGYVSYPVSYEYNGGTIYKGQYVKGFEIPEPVVPIGFKLVELYMGLQHNAHPPLKTSKLKRIHGGEE